MKRYLLTLIIFLFFSSLQVFADIVPSCSTDIKYTGIGVLKMSDKLVIYELPDENSKILETIIFKNNEIQLQNDKNNFIKNIFPVFIPKNNYVFLIVSDDSETNWYEVVYNQDKNLRGWVKVDKYQFYSWLKFYYIFGRKFGIKIFKDADEDIKTLRSDTSDDAQLLQTIVYPSYITLQILRGNWLLVRALDYNKEFKIGWLRWRDESGKLFAFPNFN